MRGRNFPVQARLGVIADRSEHTNSKTRKGTKEHVMNVGELSYPADLRAPGKMRDRIICHERVDGVVLTDLPDSLNPFVYYFFRSWFHGRFELGTALWFGGFACLFLEHGLG